MNNEDILDNLQDFDYYDGGQFKGLSTGDDKYEIYSYTQSTLKIINPSPPRRKKKKRKKGKDIL